MKLTFDSESVVRKFGIQFAPNEQIRLAEEFLQSVECIL